MEDSLLEKSISLIPKIEVDHRQNSVGFSFATLIYVV